MTLGDKTRFLKCSPVHEGIGDDRVEQIVGLEGEISVEQGNNWCAGIIRVGLEPTTTRL